MSTAAESARIVTKSPNQESAVMRYHRVARLEAILTIRQRQQRQSRQLVLWSAVILLAVLGIAAASGWL